MARLTGSSAVLLVADLERSAAYYGNARGFDCSLHGDPPNFMTAGRDAAIVLMALCTEPQRS